jgi:hypothetical protein
MGLRHALITTTAIALAASATSAADAQYAQYTAGPSGRSYPYVARPDSLYAGTYYSYGADRANPSLSPNGWDQNVPRDFQLQGR